MQGRKSTYQDRIDLLKNSKVERSKMFKKLTKHLETGYSLDCFPPLSMKTIMEFTKDYPDEFSEDLLVEAQRQAKNHWEDIGYRQALGTCLGNSRSWFYNMANRYGWRDKVETEVEHKGGVNVNVVSYASKKPS